jgi:ATP-dependent DNA helicase RecG
VCEALYLSGNIEKFGTGTLMMIQGSVEHALPEPEFAAGSGEFAVTLWRDWLTESLLARLKLNDRQSIVIPHLKLSRQLTNAEYRQLTGAAERTATRDLEDLVTRGLLVRTARTGRGTAYRLAVKAATNPPNPTPPKPDKNPPNPPPPGTTRKKNKRGRESQS